MEQEYLVHWLGKGKAAANHKYISREWKNGRWVYTYAKPWTDKSGNTHMAYGHETKTTGEVIKGAAKSLYYNGKTKALSTYGNLKIKGSSALSTVKSKTTKAFGKVKNTTVNAASSVKSKTTKALNSIVSTAKKSKVNVSAATNYGKTKSGRKYVTVGTKSSRKGKVD